MKVFQQKEKAEYYTQENFQNVGVIYETEVLHRKT